MFRFKKSISILVAPIVVLGIQVATLGAAHAAGDADLNIDTTMKFSNSALQIDIYNLGTDDVLQIVIDVVPTNFNIQESFVSQASSDLDGGSDFGTWDSNTSTWTGVLKANDSIGLLFSGEETTPIGSTISFDAEIISSELTGSVVNVDPNSGNDTSSISYTNTQTSNLNVSTRLLTTGEITDSTQLTYEATIENDGPGEYVDNGFFQVVFVLPSDSSFVDGSDVDGGDALDVLGCFNIGPLSNLGFQALQTYQYTGDAVVCLLQAPGGLSSGTSYKLEFNLIAGTEFANGNAEVIVLVQGNDSDSYSIFRALAFNEDPLEDNNGNAVYLSYDPSALVATASLCPGQPEVSIDGTACFRISFNKNIVEETFGLEDIVVTGSGTASSLTKLGNNLWELRITGIEPGKSSFIGLRTSGIVDFSAVESSTSVLGINTIRYEQTTASTGTLPETGSNLTLSLLALMMTLAGFALRFLTRKVQA